MTAISITSSRASSALADFEVVLAANFADMVDMGARGFREYFGPPLTISKPLAVRALITF